MILTMLIVSSLSFAALSPAADQEQFVKPQGPYRCPVCGMFVAKFPDWIAEIVFQDGTPAIFDGCKDLFKYYFDLKTYAPGRTRADIRAITVTDYYTVQPVNGRDAWFVLGSDVNGPMGRELVPFGNKEDARGFLKDHHGKRLLSFDEITPSVISELEQ
jgi:copper chaperone NosL